ncbi:unnamed protein product, partial [Rotaria sp. Silwood2]
QTLAMFDVDNRSGDHIYWSVHLIP